MIEFNTWMTGCGDGIITGFNYNPADTPNINFVKGVLSGRSYTAMNHPEFERSGYIVVAILSEKKNKDWVKALSEIGFKIRERGINYVHTLSHDPLLLMSLNTTRIPQETLDEWRDLRVINK